MDRRRAWFTIGMTVLMLGSIGIAAVHAEEAKSLQANWANLKQLAPGQQIRVVLNDAKAYTGEFRSVSDEGLVIRTGEGEQTLERQNILRVSTQGKGHRGRGALIGVAVGVAAALALDASVCEDCTAGTWVGDVW
jgi:hypothetical protein